MDVDSGTQAAQDIRQDLLYLQLFPELRVWDETLDRLAIPLREAAVYAAQARRNGTDFQSELLLSGLVSERGFFQALSDDLEVEHVEAVDPTRLIIDDRTVLAFLRETPAHKTVLLSERDGGTSLIVSPDKADTARLREAVEKRPALRDRLRIASPSALRSAFVMRVRDALARSATYGLFDTYPALSARVVVNGWQGLVVGALAVGLPVGLALAPSETLLGLHVAVSAFFFACVMLRFVAIRSAAPQRPIPIRPYREADMPVFSVLVALYREAEVVPDLLRALDRLAWPKPKLDIKLVCEEGDRETLEALAKLDLPPSIEIVVTPAVGPRTKPKALAYALPLARGEFVVLFDAEDRPDPLQLVQAWQRFEAAGPELACLQAPLEITNGGHGWLARMFAFEYATLFRGLLPWLAARRLVLPLGGTSNYFRRDVLERIGGWDPHNVTEDADLGVRLRRFGYHCETISCPTYEEAPEDIRTWVPQRTRWFKGYLQTWLVHMRNPARLAAQIGPGSFMIVQVLLAGMVLSALAHPLLVATLVVLAVRLASGEAMTIWATALLAMDVFNIVCGYLSFLLLGWQALKPHERRRFGLIVAMTPVYWMLMSAAAWRAVWQLWRHPHLWEKTPHPRVEGGLPSAATAAWSPAR